MKIDEMTWVEVKDSISRGVDTVVLPIGATEQHGPHGPIGTDSFCAWVVAEKVARNLGALLAPLMPYGLSSSHMNFKGTISVSPETFSMFARDVLTSLVRHGFQKIVVINGNEPNFYPFIMAARSLREETGVLITISNWFAALQETWKELPGIKGTEMQNWKWSYFMAHGGLLEVAGTMAYKPGIQRLDLATTFGSDRREVVANTILSLPSRIEEFTRDGSYGDPRKATQELGNQWTDLAAARIADKLLSTWEIVRTKP
jgi:creatinine amidohydrolase